MQTIANIHTTDIPSQFVTQIQPINNVVEESLYQTISPKNCSQIVMNHNNTNTADVVFEIDGDVSSCIDLSQISFEYDLSVVMNVDGNSLAIDDKHPVNFVDSFHSSWINSLYVDSTVSNYGARILEYALNFSQQNQMMNSLTYTLDEIQTQGNLYGYYNESRAFNHQNSKNSASAIGCDYLWGYTASPLSTKSSIERKQMLLAANLEPKRIAFRINHPFFNVNDVIPPNFGIRITLSPQNTFTSFVADTTSLMVFNETNPLKTTILTFTSIITNLSCLVRRKKLYSSALVAYQKYLSHAPRQIRYERTLYQTTSIAQNTGNMVNFNCKLGINSQVDPKALLFFFTETAAKSSYATDSHYFVSADVYKYWIDYNGKIIPSNNDLNLKMNGLNSNYSRAYQMLKEALGLHHTDTFSIKFKDGTTGSCYNRRNTIYGIPLSSDPEYDSFEGSSMGKSNAQLQLNIVFNTVSTNYDLHTILLFDEILEIDYVRNKMENISSYASRLTDVPMPTEHDFSNARYIQFGGGKISGFFNNLKNKIAAFLPRMLQAVQTYGPSAVRAAEMASKYLGNQQGGSLKKNSPRRKF